MSKVSATLRRVTAVGDRVRVFEFAVPEASIPYEPGAHIDVTVEVNGISEQRSYSLIPAGGRTDTAVIAVARQTESRGGSRYLWTLQEGATVEIATARNTFPLTFEADEYVFLAAGIGITPLLGMAQAACAAGKAVAFHYCVRNPGDLVFVEELQRMLGPRLQTYVSGKGSRVAVEELVAAVDPDTPLYVCGPVTLLNAIKECWAKAGWPSSHLRFETFASSGTAPSRAFRVVVKETGVSIEVPPDISLLDALIRSGHSMMFDCRRGECGLCKVSIESASGTLDHRDVFLSAREREAGHSMCSCVSRVAGGSVAISIQGVPHGRSA